MKLVCMLISACSHNKGNCFHIIESDSITNQCMSQQNKDRCIWLIRIKFYKWRKHLKIKANIAVIPCFFLFLSSPYSVLGEQQSWVELIKPKFIYKFRVVVEMSREKTCTVHIIPGLFWYCVRTNFLIKDFNANFIY